MLGKIGGFIVGGLAAIGAIVLLIYIYTRYRQKKALEELAAFWGSKTGSQVAPTVNDQQVTMPAPCVAAALPVAQSCDGLVFAPQTGRDDLFPGSYVNFGLYNTGCYGNVRNRKC